MTSKKDNLFVAGVNKPSLIDLANGLESMVIDIDYSVNK